MVGSGIPALSLFLLMQGSVGEGAEERVRELSREPLQPPYSPPPTPILFLHRWEWNPGILLSVE